jgi:hypothetical protein
MSNIFDFSQNFDFPAPNPITYAVWKSDSIKCYNCQQFEILKQYRYTQSFDLDSTKEAQSLSACFPLRPKASRSSGGMLKVLESR